MLEHVVLVDSSDNEIGTEEKLKAHQMGLLHRAFSIFVLRQNAHLEILMQKRALAKYHSGGLWTNSCCGHPRPLESLITAANRRLVEEIGLNVPLKEVGSFIYKADVGRNLVEHEFDHVLIGYWNNEPITLNSEEVEMVEWRKINEVLIAINQTPSFFTVWIKEALEMVIRYTSH